MKKAYIKHIVSHYPSNIAESDGKARRTKILGIYKRHYVSDGECVSDLAFIAGNKMLDSYNIDRNSIGAIVFCTQTPDFFTPATAGIMQDKLGITQKCLTFDITSGCTGYLHSLAIAKGLIESGQVNNVILFHSDMSSVIGNPKDKAKFVLFGDSVACTFIDGIEGEKEYLHSFVFGTDGSNWDKLVLKAPSYRNRHLTWEEMNLETEDEDGNITCLRNSYMDGTAVTNFTLDVTPPLLDEVLQKANLRREDIDQFFFHQPNKLLLESIRDVCRIPEDKFYIGCKNIGNTSSASIPNIINLYSADNPIPKLVMFSGFGIGLSWAGCIADLSLLKI